MNDQPGEDIISLSSTTFWVFGLGRLDDGDKCRNESMDSETHFRAGDARFGSPSGRVSHSISAMALSPCPMTIVWVLVLLGMKPGGKDFVQCACASPTLIPTVDARSVRAVR